MTSTLRVNFVCMRLYFFIATQIAGVAQLMLFRWAGQLGQTGQQEGMQSVKLLMTTSHILGCRPTESFTQFSPKCLRITSSRKVCFTLHLSVCLLVTSVRKNLCVKVLCRKCLSIVCISAFVVMINTSFTGDRMTMKLKTFTG